MAIEWPAALRPTGMTLGVTYNNRSFTSPLSNSQQVVGYPGAYWQCQLSFGVLTREQERVMTSMLGALQGMAGTVKIPTFTRRGIGDIGAAKVVTASAQSSLMVINGVTANAMVFKQGDYITVADQLFEIISDASSDASGQVTLSLNKRIRKLVAPGTAIEYRKPYALMRRMEDSHQISVQPVIASVTLQFREAF